MILSNPKIATDGVAKPGKEERKAINPAYAKIGNQ